MAAAPIDLTPHERAQIDSLGHRTLETRSLSDEEERDRQETLTLAARYLDTTSPLTMEELQTLYQVVAENYREDKEVQAVVGIAFGEAIVTRTGWEWTRITDEFGSETSITHPDYNISCHPISMIQNRIEDEEPVDLAELLDDTIVHIERRIAEGRASKRTE